MAKSRLKGTQIKTLPYPGFPTDMQPQIAMLLALSEGSSMVIESIFENRFKYVDELNRMGANIKVEGNVAIIDGIERFSGAEVSAPDLRAGAALVIAGLAGDGFTTVEQIQYVIPMLRPTNYLLEHHTVKGHPVTYSIPNYGNHDFQKYFGHRPWQRAVLNDQAQSKVIIKSRQLGLTI